MDIPRDKPRRWDGIRQSSSNRSGVIAIIAALTFPFLVAFLGLAIDIGHVYQYKRRMQAAADAGAMGGAQELYRRHSDLVTSAAKNDTALNGYDDADPGITVTVNCPPQSGGNIPTDVDATCAESGFVEVIIEDAVPSYFLRIVGAESTTIRSRAVAGSVPFNGHPCIIALSQTAAGALTVPGTSNLQADCGVMVNSTDPQGILVTGSACINATEVAVSGSFSILGSLQCVNPPPVDNVPPIIDPLAYLDPPPVPQAVVATDLVIQGTGEYFLQPGRYLGGISIEGPETLTVNFAPGTYFIDGGGLLVAGTPNLIGNEVMFYNSLTPAVSTGKFGPINIGGSVHVDFHSQTSGDYEGILFFNDREAPDPTTEPIYAIRGSADSVYEGALYFPSVHLDLQGSASTLSPWTFLIADTITVRGNYVAKSVAGGNNLTTPPTMKPTLVE